MTLHFTGQMVRKLEEQTGYPLSPQCCCCCANYSTRYNSRHQLVVCHFINLKKGLCVAGAFVMPASPKNENETNRKQRRGGEVVEGGSDKKQSAGIPRLSKARNFHFVCMLLLPLADAIFSSLNVPWHSSVAMFCSSFCLCAGVKGGGRGRSVEAVWNVQIHALRSMLAPQVCRVSFSTSWPSALRCCLVALNVVIVSVLRSVFATEYARLLVVGKFKGYFLIINASRWHWIYIKSWRWLNNFTSFAFSACSHSFKHVQGMCSPSMPFTITAECQKCNSSRR